MGNTPSGVALYKHRPKDSPVGYRVMTVQPGGPAADVRVLKVFDCREEETEVEEYVPPPFMSAPPRDSVTAWFDFIVAVNGKRLDTEDQTFLQELVANQERPITLDIFNAKCGALRVVEVVPRSWGGTGLLGVFIRFSSYSGTHDHVMRVVSVLPRSPAAAGGLVEGEDYILGAIDALFETPQDFAGYVAYKAGVDITFYVYNAARDSVRQVSLSVPNGEWEPGRTGLGMGVANGHLHSLPNRTTLGVNEFPPAAPDGAPAPAPAPEEKPLPSLEGADLPPPPLMEEESGGEAAFLGQDAPAHTPDSPIVPLHPAPAPAPAPLPSPVAAAPLPPVTVAAPPAPVPVPSPVTAQAPAPPVAIGVDVPSPAAALFSTPAAGMAPVSAAHPTALAVPLDAPAAALAPPSPAPLPPAPAPATPPPASPSTAAVPAASPPPSIPAPASPGTAVVGAAPGTPGTPGGGGLYSWLYDGLGLGGTEDMPQPGHAANK